MTTPRRPRNLSDLDGVPWRRLHLWQIQPIRDVLLILLVFGLLYLGYKIRLVTIPLLVALLLAYLFEPVVEWLTSKVRWISRRVAAGALIGATVLLIIVPITLASAWGIAQGTQFAIRQAENAANFVLFVNRTFPAPKKTDAPSPDEEPSALSEAAPLLVSPDAGTPPSTDADKAATPAAGDKADQPDTKTPAPEDDTDLVDALEVASEAADGAKEAGQGAEPAPVLMSSTDGASDGDGRDADGKRPAQYYYDKLTSDMWRWAADLLSEKKDQESARKAAALIGSMNPMPSMSQVRAYLTGFISSVAASVSLIGLFGFQLFLTAFFFFFISANYERVIEFVKNLLPTRRKDRVIELARKMDKVIAGFVRGRLVIAILQGTIFSVAYLLMGVPAAILLGFAVGILSIVPYLALIGIPLSILLLLLDGPSTGFRSEWWFTLFVPVGVYFLLQTLDDYVWTPMIQGKQTNLDTPTVLFASIAGGALAGFYGLLIAIPVAACVKILMQEVVWPRFKAWREGKVEDPLPLGGGG